GVGRWNEFLPTFFLAHCGSQVSSVSSDVFADGDAADGVAQTWTDDVEVLFQTEGLARNGAGRGIAVLDEVARIFLSEPVLRVDLCVCVRQSFIAKIEDARGFGPVDGAGRQVEPVGEFVDEEGSHRCVVGTERGRGRNLDAEIGAVAML